MGGGCGWICVVVVQEGKEGRGSEGLSAVGFWKGKGPGLTQHTSPHQLTSLTAGARAGPFTATMGWPGARGGQGEGTDGRELSGQQWAGPAPRAPGASKDNKGKRCRSGASCLGALGRRSPKWSGERQPRPGTSTHDLLVACGPRTGHVRRCLNTFLHSSILQLGIPVHASSADSCQSPRV